MEKTIYGFTARNSAGKEILFDQFRDKVLLIVNTASGCGHTPQLAELEEIYQRYKNSGLIILGFPTDQFSQEPLEGKAIDEFCSCLLYTSDAADERSSVDLGGRRIIKKTKKEEKEEEEEEASCIRGHVLMDHVADVDTTGAYTIILVWQACLC